MHRGKTIEMIKAVIFDMDGVVIDTARFWSDAEREVFTSVGVKLSAEMTAQTVGMSTSEVTEYWYDRHPWQSPSKKSVEKQVVDRVCELVSFQGQVVDGFELVLAVARRNGLKVGLATNSPRTLVETTLSRLRLRGAFQSIISFDDVHRAKPHPEAYLKCMEDLNVTPSETVIVEDSPTGVEAGIASGCCRVFYLSCRDRIRTGVDNEKVHQIAELSEVARSFLGF